MSKEKLLESHGGLLFDLDAKEPMTLEKAIEVMRVHQNWVIGEDTELLKEHYIVEAIGVVLSELERVTTRLGESLPNGGFCVKNCKQSMKPTIKHDTV
jgi:hypothetical protein